MFLFGGGGDFRLSFHCNLMDEEYIHVGPLRLLHWQFHADEYFYTYNQFSKVCFFVSISPDCFSGEQVSEQAFPSQEKCSHHLRAWLLLCGLRIQPYSQRHCQAQRYPACRQRWDLHPEDEGVSDMCHELLTQARALSLSLKTLVGCSQEWSPHRWVTITC